MLNLRTKPNVTVVSNVNSKLISYRFVLHNCLVGQRIACSRYELARFQNDGFPVNLTDPEKNKKPYYTVILPFFRKICLKSKIIHKQFTFRQFFSMIFAIFLFSFTHLSHQMILKNRFVCDMRYIYFSACFFFYIFSYQSS